MGLDNLSSGIMEFVEEHPVGTAVGVGAAVVGGAVVGAALVGAASKRRSSKTSKGRKRDRLFISKQKHERRKRKRAGKIYKRKGLWYSRTKKAGRKSKKMKTKKGIHYTKNGQPYKILASGKARFIKKTKRRAK